MSAVNTQKLVEELEALAERCRSLSHGIREAGRADRSTLALMRETESRIDALIDALWKRVQARRRMLRLGAQPTLN